MVPPTTPRATCAALLAGMRAALDAHFHNTEAHNVDLRDGYIV
jgi:hypothetical protein